MARQKDELFQIELDESSSLDVIKIEDHTLFVISERGGIQKRYVAKISKKDTIRMVKFLVGISEDEDGNEELDDE